MTEKTSPPESPPPPSAPYAPPMPYATRQNPNHRAPLLAGFLSFMPGLGNIYNGLYLRGITFFLMWGGIFALAIRTGNRSDGESEALAFLIPGLIFVWLFNLFDAYRQANLINHGYATDLGLSDSGRWTRPPGGLMLGVVILLIGVYGLLEQFFDLDLTVILDYWYLAFIAFGIWLILQARRAKTKPAMDVFAADDADDT